METASRGRGMTHARAHREARMNLNVKRIASTIAIVTVAGLAGQASSHRESPGITRTPKLDATDLYMFRSFEPDRTGFVTLLANYMPFQDPSDLPNLFQF